MRGDGSAMTYGVLTAGIVLTIGIWAGLEHNGSSQKKRDLSREVHILPNNSEQGDLNKDGLFPDAYLKESERKIPLYLHKNKNGTKYVSGQFMEELQRDRTTGIVDYERIEDMLNGK